MAPRLPSNWMTKAALVLDPYERQARLSPAFLCLAPAMVMTVSLYSSQLWSLWSLASLTVTVGVMYLLADVARSLGKAKEEKLRARWGGLPSTQVLRHSNDVFDAVTKSRYHAFLAKKIKVDFPSEADERANPAAADAIYAAGCTWLREATRDKKKFALLFGANVNYGYRRNGYGLRWLGLGICGTVIAWTFLRHGLVAFEQRVASAPDLESVLSAGEVATVLTAVCMTLLWFLYFSQGRVRQAAFFYAERLIVACEVLPATARRGPGRKSKPETKVGRATSKGRDRSV